MADEIKTPRDIFRELGGLLAREPKRTMGITAIYQFDISGEHGGKWFVKIVDGKADVVEGVADNPGCTIAMKDSDYVAMMTGELNGTTAFMTGRLRPRGDTALAIKAAGIFG